jgi:pantothenate kinase
MIVGNFVQYSIINIQSKICLQVLSLRRITLAATGGYAFLFFSIVLKSFQTRVTTGGNAGNASGNAHKTTLRLAVTQVTQAVTPTNPRHYWRLRSVTVGYGHKRNRTNPYEY